MRAANLIRIASEAELLRIQHMLKRQGVRVAYGLGAVVFGLATLVLIEMIVWQVLRPHMQPIYASLCLLGVNLILSIMFGLMAAKSSPSRIEREALVVRQRAVQEIPASMTLGALIPVGGMLLRSNRRRLRKWPFGQKRIS